MAEVNQNIQSYLPKKDEIAERIFDSYQKKGESKTKRRYLGASAIGEPCERRLWFNFRHASEAKFPGRIFRLFETGDLEEIRMVRNLRDIGCEIHEVGTDGKQFEVSAFGGHFSGHMDGCGLKIPGAEKTWHVLEFKTHNDKSYKDLKKRGVRLSKPKHFAQMQIYMHLTGMKRALYMSVNKNDDSLYPERVEYDEAYCLSLLKKAHRIIFSVHPPTRISDRADFYGCNFCEAKDICHGGDIPPLPVKSLSCRQCCHATPKEDGIARWTCDKHRRALSNTEQDKPCNDHLILPGLISFASPCGTGKSVDGNDYIVFSNHNGGSPWYVGAHPENSGVTWSSRELTSIKRSDLTNEMIQVAKACMGDIDVQVVDDILSRYPESDTRVMWSGHKTEVFEEWEKRYHEDVQKLEPIAFSSIENDRDVAEFSGGRLLVFITSGYGAEIREGVK